jgi:protein-S-isoprenylcysteine O-methyltransferase Ste14
MSIDFNFQIGLWNAWIGPVISWLTMLLMIAINPKAVKRLWDVSWYAKQDKIASFITTILMIALMIVAIWIPVKYGTIWFYSGAVIFSIGIILNLIALYNYATTPENQAILSGLYKISRNPLYLCWTIVLIGICIATTSWLMVILSVLYHVPNHYLILGEEKHCLKTYSKDYEDYMAKVPRYLLFF